jgi:hypothetical protein
MSTAQSLRLFASSGGILSFAAAAATAVAAGFCGATGRFWGWAWDASKLKSPINSVTVDAERSVFMISPVEKSLTLVTSAERSPGSK